MKLIKISSDSIQIKSNGSEFSNITINDLISVCDEKTEIVTVVTAITDLDESGLDDEDYISSQVTLKTIDCSIIGSVKNGLFVNSVDEYPTTSVNIRRVGKKEFEKMLGSFEKNGFFIGIYKNYEIPAYVNGNKFFQRHACIVGNTGSGKSETVAKILEEINCLKNANVIVFDIHGEYSNLSYIRNIKIDENNGFPIWFFDFNDICSNILKIKEESAINLMAILRKCYYSVSKEYSYIRYFDYNTWIDCMTILNNQEIATGECYKTGEKAGMPKMVKGEYFGKLTNAINNLKDKQLDKRYNFLFRNNAKEYYDDFIEKLLNNDKKIKNIDLSQVPHDMAILIIGAITKMLYSYQLSQPEIVPITIICDEAHVYIPNNFQLSASEQRIVEIFETIAKEGRKFGFTMLVASQRPSELNKTIMAQCSNFIVAKLNNETDKAMIKGMLPEGGKDILNNINMFSPGEVLIIGDSIPIPIKIKVSLAKERPLSRTIDFWTQWSI